VNSIVDLFCGCGGLSLGAYNAGFQTKLSIDIDADLSSSYSKNFPLSKLVNGDLASINPNELFSANPVGKLAGVVGGPPCQGFSIMGKRANDDPRNTLLARYFEYIKYLEPKFFVMENVPGLNEKKNRKVLDAALEILPARYNILTPQILNAKDFGAATSRPRLLVIGYDPEEMNTLEDSDFHTKSDVLAYTVRDAIYDLPSPSDELEWRSYRKTIEISHYARAARQHPLEYLGCAEAKSKLSNGMLNGFQNTNHTKPVLDRYKRVKQGERDLISKYPRLNWDKPSLVLRAGTGTDKGSFQAARPLHPKENRVITVREAARIQGFPDWFQFHRTKWHSHRMIGNSVSPIFAEAILRIIGSKLDIKATRIAV